MTTAAKSQCTAAKTTGICYTSKKEGYCLLKCVTLDCKFGVNQTKGRLAGIRIIMLYIPAEMYGDQQRRAEERRITISVTVEICSRQKI